MRWMFEHFWLKVFALAIAAVFWVAVSSERSERVLEKAYDVPIVFGAIPQHLIITQTQSDVVRVRLRGRESLLSTISSQTLEATVDLSDVRAGEITAILRPQALNLPNGVEVVSMNPPKVTFTLEQKRQKAVAIRPYVVGSPPAGLNVGSITADPPTALVSGPASVIRDYTEVSTERVLLTSQARTFSMNVGIVSDRALIRVLEPLNTRVTVELEPLEPPADLTTTAPTSTSPDESARIAPSASAPATKKAAPAGSRTNETTVRH